MKILKKKALGSNILFLLILWVPISFIFPGSLAIYSPLLGGIEVLVWGKEGGFISEYGFWGILFPCILFWSIVIILIRSSFQEKNSIGKG